MMARRAESGAVVIVSDSGPIAPGSGTGDPNTGSTVGDSIPGRVEEEVGSSGPGSGGTWADVFRNGMDFSSGWDGVGAVGAAGFSRGMMAKSRTMTPSAVGWEVAAGCGRELDAVVAVVAVVPGFGSGE